MNGKNLGGRLIVTCALAFFTSAAALAQHVGLPESLDEALQPDFLRRDLVQFQTYLQPDDGQRAILESLFKDYEAAFKEGADALRDQVNRLSPAFGRENAEVEERRDEIKQRVAQLIEESNQLKANMPQGADPDEFRKAFQQKAEQLRRDLQAMSAQPLDQEQIALMLEQTAAQAAKWHAEKSQLRSEFIARVHVLLNDDQKQAWPSLERRLVREKLLPRGRLSGESVDLFHLLNDAGMKPQDHGELSQTMNDYEVRLDGALRGRDEYLIASQEPQLQAIRTNNADQAGAIIARQIQLRVAIRDINDEFAKIIASQLNPEPGAAFIRAYEFKAFQRVFRHTQSHRMFDAARQLQGLTAEALSEIQSLQDRYQSEFDSGAARLIDLIRQHEPELMKMRAMRQFQDPLDQPSNPATNPIDAEFSRRQEIGVRYANQLRTVLTPEQFGKLPGGDVIAGTAGPDR